VTDQVQPLAGVGDHPRRSALWRLLAAPLAGLIAVSGPAAAAQAHPMGPPQQVVLSLAAPDQVQVNWKAGASDDLSWLAFDLGLLPADRIMLDGAITPQADDVRLLEDSPVLAAYLTRRISVRSGGQDCSAGRPEISELSSAGATVVFSCPSEVHQASIELGLLTDLEASYATVATGADGSQAVYNGHVTSHEWTFDPDSAPQPTSLVSSAFSWPVPVLGAVGAASAAAVGALGWWLIRSRKQVTP
jgi:hypothetical protein